MRILLACLVVFLLNGCLTIKVKTPSNTAYNFGSVAEESDFGIYKTKENSYDCDRKIKTIRLDIDIPAYLNTKNILVESRLESNTINKLEGASWIDLPSILFKEKLESSIASKCYSIGFSNDTLKLKFVSFNLVKDKEQFAQIRLNYFIYHGSKLVKSGGIDSIYKVLDDTTNSKMQAMQNAINKVILDIRDKL